MSSNDGVDGPWCSSLESNEIRVLRLSKGSARQTELLQCELEVIRLGDREFDAVSYVWGPQHLTGGVICNGHHVKIPLSLSQALWRFWAKNPELLIWVDALSINQNNLTEKQSQVSLMGQIFANAQAVRIWLSEERAYAADVWNTLQRHSLFDSNMVDEGVSLVPNHIVEEDTINSFLGCFLDLTNASWFQRVWTFQEIVLARRAIVCCGDLEMDWEDFASSSINIARYKRYVSEASNIQRCRQSYALESSMQSLSTHLGRNWRRDCFNPRDKIYGLLGLFKSRTYPINVDYSLAINQVYAEASLACLNVEGDLSILNAAGLEHRIFDRIPRFPDEIQTLRDDLSHDRIVQAIEIERNLPSWCPNWYLTLGFAELTTRGRDDKSEHWPTSTEYMSKPCFNFEESNLLLQIRGFVVGYFRQSQNNLELCEIPDIKNNNFGDGRPKQEEEVNDEHENLGTSSSHAASIISSLESIDGSYNESDHLETATQRKPATSSTSTLLGKAWYLKRYLEHSSETMKHVKPTEPSFQTSQLLDAIEAPTKPPEEKPYQFCRKYHIEDISTDVEIQNSYIAEGDWLTVLFGSTDLYVLRPQRSAEQESASLELEGRDSLKFVLVQRLISELSVGAHTFFKFGIDTFPPQVSPSFNTETLDFNLC